MNDKSIEIRQTFKLEKVNCNQLKDDKIIEKRLQNLSEGLKLKNGRSGGGGNQRQGTK